MLKNYCLKKAFPEAQQCNGMFTLILLIIRYYFQVRLNKRPIHCMPMKIICDLFITRISCYHLYRYLRIQYLSSLKPLRSYEKVICV